MTDDTLEVTETASGVERLDAAPLVTRVSVSLRKGAPAVRAAEPPGAMPTSGPLIDRFGRLHDDLRLSVTDRCNFRCVYCMPEEGMVFCDRRELLSLDELERVSSVARSLGVTSVRLTGGEPLVRRGVVGLVRRLDALGFEDIAMTTNGTGLVAHADALVSAGLRRVNISCDSLQPERFAEIRRRGELAGVLAAMDAAESAGLAPIKVNVVLISGVNDDEVLDFASFGRRTGRTVRFIEFMPLDAPGHWSRDDVVAGEEVVRRIHEVWPLEPVAGSAADPAPAQRFRYRDGCGEVGLISSVTQPFCGTCNRLRVTADGAIRNCLFSDDELSLRELLRSGADDGEIATVFRQAVWGKLPGHGINDPGFLRPRRSMSMIGG